LKEILFIPALLCFSTLGFSQKTNQLLQKVFEPVAFANIATSFKNKQVLPSSYYVSQLGFFCKQEIKFEKVTSIPLKIRVGSIEYCDWMEGKKTSTYRPNY
jgi:hypothetical protein